MLKSLPDEIEVDKTNIISSIIKPENVTCNMKFMGYFNKEEIYDEITAGMIGPEIRHIWDEKPLKQSITVSYESEQFYDILVWERDLSLDEPEWQVANINYIVKN